MSSTTAATAVVSNPSAAPANSNVYFKIDSGEGDCHEMDENIYYPDLTLGADAHFEQNHFSDIDKAVYPPEDIRSFKFHTQQEAIDALLEVLNSNLKEALLVAYCGKDADEKVERNWSGDRKIRLSRPDVSRAAITVHECEDDDNFNEDGMYVRVSAPIVECEATTKKEKVVIFVEGKEYSRMEERITRTPWTDKGEEVVKRIDILQFKEEPWATPETKFSNFVKTEKPKKEKKEKKTSKKRR